MKEFLNKNEIDFVEKSQNEMLELLIDLAKIPAPSHKEEKRVEFCKAWFEKMGATNVYVDDAKNVVYPLNCDNADEIIVFMAHTDVVFDDETELPLKVENGRVYAPGVGDDTANLVNLMMCAKYITENKLSPKKGFLFVANSCEEGLGNLKGSKKIVEQYGSRITEFISFDGHMGGCINKSVGSHRYNVTVTTEGGHSYSDFGNQSSIYFLSSIIQTLYAIRPPKKAKTTFNVGMISGGTSVNTIAQKASMFYEFRSEDRECLKEMEDFFLSVVDTYRKMNIGVEVETVGIRPCDGDVDAEKLNELTNRSVEIIKAYYDGEVTVSAASTDANIPLSQGIISNTVGTVIGGGAHTRGEWIEIASLNSGLKISLALVMQYFNR